MSAEPTDESVAGGARPAAGDAIVAAFDHGTARVSIVDAIVPPADEAAFEAREDEELPRTALLIRRLPGGDPPPPGAGGAGPCGTTLLVVQRPFVLTVALALDTGDAEAAGDPGARLEAFCKALWNKYRCAKSAYGMIARVDGCATRGEAAAAKALDPFANRMERLEEPDARGRDVCFTGRFMPPPRNFITAAQPADTAGTCALPRDLLAVAPAGRWRVLELLVPNYHAAVFVAWCVAAQGLGTGGMHGRGPIAGMPSALLHAFPAARADGGGQYVCVRGNAPFDALVAAQLPPWTTARMLTALGGPPLPVAEGAEGGATVIFAPCALGLTDDLARALAAERLAKLLVVAATGEGVRTHASKATTQALVRRIKEARYDAFDAGVSARRLHAGALAGSRLGFADFMREPRLASSAAAPAETKRPRFGDGDDNAAGEPAPKKARRVVVNSNAPALPPGRGQAMLSQYFRTAVAKITTTS